MPVAHRRTLRSLQLGTALATTLYVGGLPVPAFGQSATDPLPVIVDPSRQAPSFNATLTPTTPAPGASGLDVDLNDTTQVINWQTFNVAQNNVVHFTTADNAAQYAVLNRVIGLDADSGATRFRSMIDGMLSSKSNIAVWLSNPEGITVGPGGSFSGGSLVLTTLDIGATDFLDGYDGDPTTGTSVNFLGASTNDIVVSGGTMTLGPATLTANNGSILLVAQKVSNAGSISASGDAALVAAQDVTFNSGVGSPLDITITTGTTLSGVEVIGSGSVAGQSVALVATGVTGVMGALLNVDSGATLTATADGGGIVLATKDFAGSTVPDNGNGIVSAGTLNAGGGTGRYIALESGGDATISGTASASGDVVVDADGAAALSGAVTASGGNYTVSGGSVALGGASSVVQSAGGNVDITATAGNITGASGLTLRSDADAAGGGYVVLDAGTGMTGGAIDFALGSSIQAGATGTDSVGLIFGSAQNLNLGDVTGVLLGGVSGTAGARNTFTGSISTTGDLRAGTLDLDGIETYTVGGDMRVGSLTAGEISLTVGGDLTGLAGAPAGTSDINFGRAALTATAGPATLGVGGLAQLGAVSSLNRITITAGAGGMTPSNGAIDATSLTTTSTAGLGGNIALTAVASTPTDPAHDGDIRIGSATAAGGVSLVNTAGDSGAIAATGNITAGAGVTVDAEASATLAGDVTAGGGTYTVTGSTIALGGASQTATGAVSLTATAGDVTGANGLTLQSNSDGVGAEALSVSVTGGNIAFADQSSLLGGAARQSNVSLNAGAGSVAFDDVSALGLTATGSGGISSTGTIGVTDSLSLATAGALSLNAANVTAGDITLTGGPSTTASSLVASGSVTASGDTVNIGSATATAGSLMLTADVGDLTLGTGSAGTTAALSATSAAVLSVTDSLTSVGSQTLTLTGTGNVSANSLVTTGAGSDISVTSGSVSVTSASAADALTLTATNGDVSLGTGTAGGSFALATQAGVGNVFVTGGVSGGSASSIVSVNNARIASASTSAGDLTVTASGSGSVTGLLPNGNANLAAGAGDVIVTGGALARLGVVTTGGASTNDLIVRADAISVDTATVAGAIDLVADAGSAALGTGSAGTTALVQGSGNASVTTGLTSVGNLTLTAGGAGTASSPTLTSSGGDVTVSGGSVTVTNASAADALALTATTGNLSLGSGSAVTTAALDAADQMFLGSGVGAGAALSLTAANGVVLTGNATLAGSAITVNNAIDAQTAGGQSLTLNSAGTTTLRGAVGAGAALASLSATGPILLANAANSIRTVDALALGAVTFDASLAGDVTLSASAADGTIAVGVISDADATLNNLTLTALGGIDATDMGSVSNPLGDITFNGDTTLGTTIVSAGAVVFNEDLVLADGTHSITGASTEFNGTINGENPGTADLSVTATGTTNTFDDMIGNVSALAALTVTGATALNAGTVTTTGAQTYNGNVTLGANTVLDADALTFNGTLGGAFALSAIVANATTFGNAVGDTVNLASLTTDASGTTVLNGGSVTTTGAQTYGDAVTLGASTTLTGGSGSFAAGVDGGGFDLTLDFGGTTALDGTFVNIGALTTDGGGTTTLTGAITTTGTQTYNDAVVLTGTGADLVANGPTSDIVFAGTVDSTDMTQALSAVAGDDIEFLGAVGGGMNTALASLAATAGGSIDLNGGFVTTIGGQTYAGDVVLTLDTILTSTAMGDIAFGGAVDSDSTTRALTVNTAGTTSFAGAVGNDSALTSLTTDMGGGTAIGGGSVITTGGQTYNDAVTLGAATALESTMGGQVRFADTLDGPGSLTVTTTGLTRFDGVVGGSSPLATLSTGQGGVAINTTAITTASTQNYTSAVTLGADATLDAGAGSVTFVSTIDGARALTVNTTGNTVFGGAVGEAMGGALTSLTTNSGGSTIFVGGSVTTSGTQDYNDTVLLFTDTTLTSTGMGPAGNITLAGTVDSLDQTQGLTVATAGTTTFGSAIGGGMGTALQFLTTSSGGTTALNGGSVSTTGGQTYGDAVTLGMATTLTSSGSGTIDFISTVNGAQTLGVDTSGLTIFRDDVGAAMGGALTSLTTDADGTTQLQAGTVTTSGAQTYNDDVTLSADTTLNAGALTFNGTVGGPFALIANVAGATTFGDAVGDTVSVASLTTDSAGSTVINGGSVTTSGAQTYGDAVTLGADTVLTGGLGTFAAIAGSGNDLTLNFSGATVVNGTLTGVEDLVTNPGGSTRFNGGTITTTGAQTFNDQVMLGMNTVFTGTAGDFAAGLDGNGSDLTLNFSAPSSLTGAFTEIDDLVVNGGSTTSLAGSIATTGSQTYSDAIQLPVASTLSSSNSGTIAFGSTIDGPAGLIVTTGGATTFAGPIGGDGMTGSPLASLTVSGVGGTTALNGGSVRTTGAQTYGNAVTLGNATTLTSTGGGAIDFASTLNGAHALAVNTAGLTIFRNAVGGMAPLASLTTDMAGTTTIHAGTVTTTGPQTYNDPVTLSTDTTLVSSGVGAAGDVTFASTVRSTDQNQGLTVTTAGTTTFGGIVGGGTGTALEFLATDGGGSTAINTTAVTTAATQTYSDAVTLGADTVLTSTGIGPAGDIGFGSTVDGARALTVTTAGTTIFAGVVGGTGLTGTPLTSLTVNGGGTTAINGGAVTTTGAQTYGDALTLGLATTLSGSAGTFAAITGNGFDLTFDFSGLTTLGGAVAGVEDLLTDGATAINGGSVSTSGAQTYGDAVTLGADTTLTSTGGDIVFGGTVDSASAMSPRALTVTTGGSTEFLGAVGAGAALASLTTNGGGTTDLNGGPVVTTGAQTYSDDVVLTIDTTLTSTMGGAIAFAGRIDSDTALTPRALTVTTSGAKTFGDGVGVDAIGGNAALASLTASGGGAILLNAGSVETTLAQTYTDAVTLGADTTLNAGTDITFAAELSSLDGTQGLTATAGGAFALNDVTGGASPLESLTVSAASSSITDATVTNAAQITTSAATQIGTLTAGSIAISGAQITGLGAGNANLAATAGDVTVTAGTLARLGAVSASGVGSDIVVTGDVVSVDSAIAGGFLNLAADVGSLTLAVGNAGADATLRGASVTAGTVTATNGALLIDATGGNATLGTGSAGTTATVQATGDATVTGNLTAAGDLTLIAGSAGIASAPSLTSSGGDVTVMGGTVTVTDAEAGDALALTATTGDLTLGTGSAGTTASLTTNVGDVLVNTSLSAGTSATISSASDARLAQVTASNGDVSVTAASGEVTGIGAGNVNLSATAGDVTVTAGTLARLGTVGASGAGSDIVVTGDVVSVDTATAGGLLSLAADVGNLTLGTGSAGTAATLTKTGASGELAVTNAVTGGTGVTISSATDARIANATASTGNLTANAAGALSGVGGGRANFTATTGAVAASAGTSALLGTVGAGTSATLSAGTSLDVTTVTAGTDTTLSGASVTAGNATASSGALAIDATAGAVTLGTGSAGTTATLNASGDIILTSKLVAGGNIALDAGDDVLIAEYDAGADTGLIRSTSGDVTIDADGSVHGIGGAENALPTSQRGIAALTTNGNLTINSDGDARFDSLGATGSITLDVAGSLTGSPLSGGTATGTNVPGGAIFATGAGGDVTIRSGLAGAPSIDVVVLNRVIADRNITINADQLAIGTLTTNSGTITLNDTSGAALTADNYYVGMLNAAGDLVVVLTGQPTAAIPLVATDAGGAPESFDASFGKTDLTAGTSLTGTIGQAAQLGDVGFGTTLDLDTAALVADTLSSTNGSADILASTGTLAILTTTLGGPLTLTKQGGSAATAGDELRLRSVTAGGSATLTSSTHQRIGSLSSGGNATASAVNDLTGLLGASSGTSDTAFGRANVTASGNNAMAVGGLAQLGTASAGTSLSVTAGNAASDGSIDVTTAQAGTDLSLVARADAPVADPAHDGDILVGTATAGITLLVSNVVTGGDSGNVVATGAIQAGGDTRIDAANDATLGSSVTTTGGSLGLRARRDITTASLTASEDIGFSAGRNASLGALSAGDDILVTTGGTLTVASATASGTGPDGRTVSFASPTSIAFPAETNLGADIVFSSTGASVTANGPVTAASDVTVGAATGVAHLSTTTATAGNVTVTSGTSTQLVGDVTSGINTTVTAGTTAAIQQNVTAGGNYSVTAGTGATLGDASARTQQANGSVSITANSGDVAQGTGRLTIVSNANQVGTETLTITASNGNILLANSQLTGGSIAGRESDVVLIASGTITADDLDGDRVGMTAGGNIVADTIEAGTGAADSADLADRQSIDLVSTGGSVTVNTAQAFGAGHDIDIRAANALTANSLNAGGSLVGRAGQAIAIGTTTAGEDVALKSNGSSITITGATTAGDDVLLTAAGAMTTGGAVTASGTGPDARTVTFGAGALDAAYAAETNPGADVVINSTGASTTANGAVTAVNDVTVNAATSVAHLSATTATSGNVTVTSGTSTQLVGDVTSGIDTTVTAGTTAAIEQNVTAGGNYTVTGGTGVVLGDASARTQQANGSVSITATSGDVAQGAGRLTVISNADQVGTETLTVTATNGNIVLANSQLTGGSLTDRESDVVLSASGAITADDLDGDRVGMTAGGNIFADTIEAGTGASDPGDLADRQSIDLASNGGSVSLNTAQAFGAGHDIDIRAANGIAANSLNAGGTLVGRAGQAIAIGTATAGEDVALRSNGSTITITGAANAGDDVLLTAAGAITTGGAVTASGTGPDTRTVTFGAGALDAAYAAETNPGADVVFSSTGASVTANGAVNAASDVTVNAATSVAHLSSTTATSGNVTVTSGTSTELVGDVTSGINTTVTAGTTAAIQQNVTAGANYTVTAGTGVTLGDANARTQQANGSVAITATSDDVAQGAGRLTVISNADQIGTETLTLTASNGNIVLANSQLTGGSLAGRESDVVLSASGAITADDLDGDRVGMTAGGNIVADTIEAGTGAADSGDLADRQSIDLVSSGGSVTVNTGQAFGAGHDIDIRAANALSANSLNAGGTLVGRAGQAISIGTATAGEDVALRSNGSSITITGAANAGDDVLLTAAGAIATGSVSATGTGPDTRTVVFGAGALDAAYAAEVNPGADIVISSTGASTTANGAVSAASDVTVNAATSVAHLSTTNGTTGNVTVTSGTSTQLVGDVTSGISTTVNAGSTASVLANVTAGGNYTVTAGTGVTLGDASARTQQANGNVSITATSGDVAKGSGRLTVIANADRTAANNAEALTINAANGNISLSQSHLIGSSTTGRESDIRLTARGITVGRVDGASLTARATTGFTANEAIVAGNAARGADPVNGASTVDIAVSGGGLTFTDITATNTGHDVTLSASGAISGNNITAARTVLVNGGSVSVTGATTAAANSVTVNGGGSASLGSLSAATTGAVTAGTINVGTATTGGTLSLNATGSTLTLGSATSGGDVTLAAATRATLGPITATGRNVALSAMDADVNGAIAATRIDVIDRAAGANPLRLGDAAPGGGGFALSQAEFNRLNAATVVLDAGTTGGGARQDVAIGALAIDADTGSTRLDLLGQQRFDVTGTISAMGDGSRTFRLGGAVADGTRATTMRFATTADGGGRVLIPGIALDLRADRIGMGFDATFLASIGLTPGGSPLDPTTVAGQYIANGGSTLYNSDAFGAGTYSNQTILTAGSLTVRYADYALFQNTGGTAANSGADLASLSDPSAPALILMGPNPPDAGGFALFGTINGVPDSAAAVLGDQIITLTAVDRLNARVNGCLIGSGSGCIASTTSQPPLPPLNAFRGDIFSSQGDLSIPFDPVVGTNNESLFGDVGSFGLSDLPLQPLECDPEEEGTCPSETEETSQ